MSAAAIELEVIERLSMNEEPYAIYTSMKNDGKNSDDILKSLYGTPYGGGLIFDLNVKTGVVKVVHPESVFKERGKDVKVYFDSLNGEDKGVEAWKPPYNEDFHKIYENLLKPKLKTFSTGWYYGNGNMPNELTGTAKKHDLQYFDLTKNKPETIIKFGLAIGFVVQPIRTYYRIQERLNAGETPLRIYKDLIKMGEPSEEILKSLYGKTYAGGLIFYLNTEDGNGLVAAKEDQGIAEWGSKGVDILDLPNTQHGIDAEGGRIGDGMTNTKTILKDPSRTAEDKAAELCGNYNGGDYNDWFLPSFAELDAMYTNLHTLGYGGFSAKWYWGSTEYDEHEASSKHFTDGQGVFGLKNTKMSVRAARTFTDLLGAAPPMELFPIGEGGRMGNEVRTDNRVKIKFLFVYFKNAEETPVAPTKDRAEIWKKLVGYLPESGKNLLEEGFKKQGLAGLDIDAEGGWTLMNGTIASYKKENTKTKPDGTTETKEELDYKKYVKDAHAIMGDGPFDDATILVVVPHDPDKLLNGLVREGAHGSDHIYKGETNLSKGIKSTSTLLATSSESEDFRLLMHEMGHSFGSSDLYPEEGENHEVGGFGMMADSRFSTAFLGWTRFRYGWLAKERTKQLTKKGTYLIDLKKPTSSTGITTIAFPDPDKYNKFWVIELNNEMRTGLLREEDDGTLIYDEGKRVIVYTVEEPNLDGKQAIRLIQRTTPPAGGYAKSKAWADTKSYGSGQSFPVDGTTAPFSFNVVGSITDGFTIRLTIAADLEERNYPKKLTAGDFKTHVSYDLDLVVSDETKKLWNLKKLFPKDLRADNYIALRKGEIQLIGKELITDLKHKVSINAPTTASVKYNLTEEGKVQVVDKNDPNVMYWENFHPDEESPNKDYELVISPQIGNLSVKDLTETTPKWIYNFREQRVSEGNRNNTYISFNSGSFEVIHEDTQAVVETIDTGAPAGSKLQVTNEGKIQVVDKDDPSTIYWENFSANQASPNSQYKLLISPRNGNIQVKDVREETPKWPFNFMLQRVSEGNRNKTYISFNSGSFEVIHEDTQAVVETIDTGAPEGSKLQVTNEGKIQVVDKDDPSTTYWENFSANQASPNNQYKLLISPRNGNIQVKDVREETPKWPFDLLLHRITEVNRTNTYVSFVSGSFQVINQNTQAVVETIDTGAPEGSKLQVTNEGKVQVVDKDNSNVIYWESLPPNQKEGEYDLVFNRNNIILFHNKNYRWDALTQHSPFNNYPPASLPHSFRFIIKDHQLQLVSINSVSIIDALDLGAGAVKLKLYASGKIDAVKENGDVVSNLYIP